LPGKESKIVAPEAYGQLAECFSPSVLADLAFWGRCGYIGTVVRKTGYHRLVPRGITLGQFFDHLYAFLRRYYRSEYVYKNALANKILLGRHSLRTSTLLTEFKTGAAQADVVVLNCTSSAYEIKTELDNLGRLEGQMDSYLRVFDRVYVVTHESLLKKVERTVPAPVGIILLTRGYTLRPIREAAPNAGNVDASAVFRVLRREEYCRIIEREYGSSPDPAHPDFHEECHGLFSNLPPATAHDAMIGQLRGRVKGSQLAPFVGSLPHSLRLLCMARGFTRRQQSTILSAVSEDFEVNCRTSFDLTPDPRRRHVLSLPQGQAV
jgi:hypothetical protein